MPRHDAVGLSVVLASVGAIFYAMVCGGVHLLAAHGLAPDELARLELRPFPRSFHTACEVGYMAVVCVTFITLAQTWAMQRLSAATAAVIFALEPVAATTLAILVDGASEWPGPRGVAGAFCVLCAVYVAERRNLRRQTRAATSRSGANA
jgi:drug/metabolite transporter (DMT)-like permease